MKIKNFMKKYSAEVFLVFLFVVLISAVSVLCVSAYNHEKEQEEYFNSLTPQQQQEYLVEKEAEEQARREANITEYEVVSVFRYIENRTNQFGGITDTNICYAFEYVDASGKLHSVNGFENLEHGLTKVVIGDKNMYIVDKNGEEHQHLQLTKETLKEMKSK